MTTPEETGPADPARRARRVIRVVILCIAVAAILFLAAAGWLRGR